MADPTIQTFCCHNRIRSEQAVKLMAEFNTNSYIIVCLVSSLLGILGSIYQIFIRNEEATSGQLIKVGSKKNTGRKIIIWLAVADLCASAGVFVRSALWRYLHNMFPPDEDGGDATSVVFCAVSSAWTQYFYMCTWLWTFCYAINVRMTLKKKTLPEVYYHTIIWAVAAILTAIGTSVLYYPDADCHDIHRISTAFFRIMPNYVATYGPMILVMVGNPIIYTISCREVDKQIMGRYSQITSSERVLMDKFKAKFSMINLVFYVCWLPNLVNGIILWTMWFNLPIKVIIATWYMMAITNPLQAFLNCLVYRRWTCTWKIRRQPENPGRPRPTSVQMSEQTPLLRRTSLMASQSTASFAKHLVNDEEIVAEPNNSVNSCSLV